MLTCLMLYVSSPDTTHVNCFRNNFLDRSLNQAAAEQLDDDIQCAAERYVTVGS